jgi:hypothetical protein
VNFFAEYPAYIGNATVATSATNPFIYTAYVAPDTPTKKKSLVLIFSIVAGGVVLVLVAFGLYCWKCRKPKE